MFSNASFSDLWKPLVSPSKALKDAVPKSYFDLMLELHTRWKKNPNRFIQDMVDREDLDAPTSAYHLSLPRRKRYVGLLPISIEIGLFNTPTEFHYRILERIIQLEESLGNVTHDIAHLPDAKNFLEIVYDKAPLSGTNLGVFAHSFFHTRFEMTGASIFSLDDKLFRELCDTDISSKTPCEFLRTPMPFMYLEFGQTRHLDLPRTFNEQSGWHIMEGAYLNSYTLRQDELIREIESPDAALMDITKPHNRFNAITHALLTGFITKNGGDVQIIEVLATGSPLGKGHVLDDSTHQFVLIIQDRDMDVETLLDWHIKYNRRELISQIDIQTGGATDSLPVRSIYKISDEEEETLSNAVHCIAKALLYINSDTCKLTHLNDATEAKKVISRTQNKAKIRKLESRAKSLSDYILITLPKDVEDELNYTRTGEGSSKSTHWRRAHFHPFKFGKGRTQTRIKWIPRKLVNAVKGLTPSREYKIK